VDFRVASKVFWSAACAIQRGIPDTKVRTSVWTQIWGSKLSRAYKATVAEESARKAWEFEGSHILEAFEKKFITWTEDWMASAAGQEYVRIVELKKYAISVRRV
jgi:hypothetical protein